MMRAALLFAVAFGVSAAAASVTSGCGPDCGCPDGPPLPSPLTPQRISSDSTYENASGAIDLSTGTLEIAGAKLIVRYQGGGASHQLTYKIYPNP